MQDSVGKILLVSFLLCVVCSVMVSSSAVFLRPKQRENRELDFKKNLLLSSGLIDNNASKKMVLEQFAQIKTIVVDLETGMPADEIEPEAFDQLAAAKDPRLSKVIVNDVAGIKRREKYSKVYLAYRGNKIDMVILPIYGKGLWSTLYGFLALETDANTIRGLGFYQHGETPGLGGEIDNPRWKAIWTGKQIYDSNWTVAINIIKGKVTPTSDLARHQIDGLSGATITSNGVENLVRYWLGEDGFYNYLSFFRRSMYEY